MTTGHRRPIAAACVALVVSCVLASGAHAASLGDIRERGWLRVCAHPDALPFSSQDRAQPGFQLEIADAVARILGVRVTPEWIVFSRHARRAECDAVIGGVVQLTGEDHGPRRNVLLTKPYAGSGYVLLVPRANTLVHRPDDVKAGNLFGIHEGGSILLGFDAAGTLEEWRSRGQGQAGRRAGRRDPAISNREAGCGG